MGARANLSRSTLVRLLLTTTALCLWWWGIHHWPHLPHPYASGFWVWAAAFPLLLVTWAPRPPSTAPRFDGWSLCALTLFSITAATRFYRVDTLPFAIHFDTVAAWGTFEAMQRGQAENIFSRFDPWGPGLQSAVEWLLALLSQKCEGKWHVGAAFQA